MAKVIITLGSAKDLEALRRATQTALSQVVVEIDSIREQARMMRSELIAENEVLRRKLQDYIDTHP